MSSDDFELNQNNNEKQISEKDYIFAFEVFAKLWAEKLKEINHLSRKLEEKNALRI